jgi:REP element-mobilizing transposase RayT
MHCGPGLVPVFLKERQSLQPQAGPGTWSGKKGTEKGDITNIANPRIAPYDEGMPRTARASVGGMWYHVLKRGNRPEAVLYKSGDYDAFVEVIIDARARLPVHVLGYCLMPNYFHLVIRPQADGDLGRWVQRLLMARPTLSPPLRHERARLAWTFQGIHHSGRRSSPNRIALRRAQRLAGPTGDASGGLEMVQSSRMASS